MHLLTYYENPKELDGLPALQELGITVEVVPKPRPGPLLSLSSLFALQPNFVKRHSSDLFLARLRDRLRGGGIHAVHLDGLPLAHYAPLLAKDAPSVVLDMRDAWSLLYHRQLERTPLGFSWARQWLKWRIVKRYESKALRYPARTVLLSTHDRATLAEANPHANAVTPIPNGVDTDYFQPDPTRETECTLLFTGALDYAPNAEAVEFFIREVQPLLHDRFPNVRLVVAGRNPPNSLQALNSSQIVITGFVPDMRPYFDEATVVICPLLTGAGIKNKLLEAMSMGKAIVATPIAAEGIPLIDGTHALIRKDPKSMSDAIAALLNSQATRLTLGTEARAFVENQYSWDAAAKAFEELYAIC